MRTMAFELLLPPTVVVGVTVMCTLFTSHLSNFAALGNMDKKVYVVCFLLCAKAAITAHIWGIYQMCINADRRSI